MTTTRWLPRVVVAVLLVLALLLVLSLFGLNVST
jgi:hypothetical protein